MAILCGKGLNQFGNSGLSDYTIVPEYGNVGGFDIVGLHSEMVDVEGKVQELMATRKGKYQGAGNRKVGDIESKVTRTGEERKNGGEYE